MRTCVLPLLLAGALHAAVIRGVVVENQTGKPLARALVVAQPVSGTAGGTLSARTDGYGVFEFSQLSGGAYLISAARRSFAPVQYGQKRWKGAGVPVVVDEAGSTFLNVRMQRFGSIAGTVVDENEVGLPEHDVVVYRNTRPPQLAGKGRTDDRGYYRIWGLDPGAYLVRTIGKQYEEGGYLPTFSRQTTRVEEARSVEVVLDQQNDDNIVRPFPGQLFNVSGRANTNVQVTITLISDVGTETTVSDNRGEFKFNPLPPGQYEILAQSVETRRGGYGMTASYLPLLVDRDRTDTRLTMLPLPDLRVAIEDTKGQAMDLRTMQIWLRRKDLSGEGKAETLRRTAVLHCCRADGSCRSRRMRRTTRRRSPDRITSLAPAVPTAGMRFCSPVPIPSR